MLTVIPRKEITLLVTVIPVPILDHLSTLPACLGLAIEGKLLNLALNRPSFTNLQAKCFVHVNSIDKPSMDTLGKGTHVRVIRRESILPCYTAQVST